MFDSDQQCTEEGQLLWGSGMTRPPSLEAGKTQGEALVLVVEGKSEAEMARLGYREKSIVEGC